MTLGPVISSSRLAKDKVVRSEDLTKRSRSDAVHGARLQVHQHGPGDVLATGGLIVVHVDPLKLKLGSSTVGSSWVNTVFIRDNLPELKIVIMLKCKIRKLA